MLKKKIITLLFIILMICWGCSSINDERIPLTSVRIEVTLAQQQNTEWWANAPATHVSFLKPNIPYGFPYTISATTGYGGVLQVCGFDNDGIAVLWQLKGNVFQTVFCHKTGR